MKNFILILTLASVTLVQAHTFETFKADFGTNEPSVRTTNGMMGTITTYTAVYPNHGFLSVGIMRFSQDVDMPLIELLTNPALNPYPSKATIVDQLTIDGHESVALWFTDTHSDGPYYVIIRAIAVDKRTHYTLTVSLNKNLEQNSIIQICDKFFSSFSFVP